MAMRRQRYTRRVSARAGDDDNAQLTRVTGKTTQSACDDKMFVQCLFGLSATSGVCTMLYPLSNVTTLLQIDELDTEQQKHDISLYIYPKCVCLLYIV